MELPAWNEELVETLHRNGRGRVLKALLALGNPSQSTKVFHRAGVPLGSKTQFIDDLTRRGLVREQGTARGGRNQQTKVIELTDEGHRVAKELMERHVDDPIASEEPDEVGEIRSQLADLNRRLSFVEQDIYGSEDGRERITALREEADKLEATLNSIGDELGDVSKQGSGDQREVAVPGAESF